MGRVGRFMSGGSKALLALGIAVLVVLGGVGIYLAVYKSSGTAKVSVYLKDLPATWSHMNVTFSSVEIHQADADNQSGWHTLPIANQTLDLSSLVNVSGLLASGNVSHGKYTQIRLVVISVTGTMANGTIVNFTVPSGELKTTHPFNLTAGDNKTFTIDIDLSQSIVQNSSGWIFKPVLGAISES